MSLFPFVITLLFPLGVASALNTTHPANGTNTSPPGIIQRDGDGQSCAVCQDGSPITKPNGIIKLDGKNWKCSELDQMLWLLDVPSDWAQCNYLNIRGYLSCGCPTFVGDDYCTLCPHGFADLPDPNITIPGFTNLTCGDILVARRDDYIQAPVSCNELTRYSQLCKCPETCSFCRYRHEYPAYPDRVIPYLTLGGKQVTCGDHAAEASNLTVGEGCDKYHEVPVSINVESYCGCPQSSVSNLCPLCPRGRQLRNPNLVLPNVGGLTCKELQDYLQFVTDFDTCTAISARSQACCESFDPCPICKDGKYAYGRGSGQVYEPYNLGCDQIGQATHFGFPLNCESAQESFPSFCKCEYVLADCTICPKNRVPPEPSRFIPRLNITCGEANDFVSTKKVSECDAARASFKVDVAAFCGCGKDSSLFGRCAFCPADQELRFNTTTAKSQPLNIFRWSVAAKGTTTKPKQASIFHSLDFINGTTSLPHQNIFGSPFDSGSVSIAQLCLDVAVIAPYVIEEKYCKEVQQSIPECCRPRSTQSPSWRVTFPPTPLPSPNATNTSFWDIDINSSSTNQSEVIAPTPSLTLSGSRGCQIYKGTGLVLSTTVFMMF